MKENMYKKCPKCGNEEFLITPHVIQTWKVDRYGNYLTTITECDEVVYTPGDDDIWTCANDECDWSGLGADCNYEPFNPAEVSVNLSIKFDHPVDKDVYFVSPGGYEVRSDSGEVFQFDFEDYRGNTDENDPTVVHFVLKNADIDSFPKMKDMMKQLHHIVTFSECYICSGKTDDEKYLDKPEILPVKVLRFTIFDNTKYQENLPESTEFVNIWKDEDNGLVSYDFTKKLLDIIPWCTTAQ